MIGGTKFYRGVWLHFVFFMSRKGTAVSCRTYSFSELKYTSRLLLIGVRIGGGAEEVGLGRGGLGGFDF